MKNTLSYIARTPVAVFLLVGWAWIIGAAGARAAEPPAAPATKAPLAPRRQQAPPQQAARLDTGQLVRKEELNQYVSKSELAQYARKADVDALRLQLEQMLEALRAARLQAQSLNNTKL